MRPDARHAVRDRQGPCLSSGTCDQFCFLFVVKDAVYGCIDCVSGICIYICKSTANKRVSSNAHHAVRDRQGPRQTAAAVERAISNIRHAVRDRQVSHEAAAVLERVASDVRHAVRDRQGPREAAAAFERAKSNACHAVRNRKVPRETAAIQKCVISDGCNAAFDHQGIHRLSVPWS